MAMEVLAASGLAFAMRHETMHAARDQRLDAFPRLSRRRSTMGDLVDCLVARSVKEIFARGRLLARDGDMEQVHRFRVATRRLRSDLGTYRKYFEKGALVLAQSELRWLARVAGAVRDPDVLGERFRARRAVLPAADRPALSMLLGRLESERAAALTELQASISSRRFVALHESLLTLLAPSEPDPAAVTHRRNRPAERSRKRVAARYGALARFVAAMPAAPCSDCLLEPSDATLHAARILAKRCRYAAESVEVLVGEPAREFAHSIAEMQSLLGEHQDTVAAEAWLREAISSTDALQLVAGELIALERLDRARCRAAWSKVWRRASKKRRRTWL
jgi:CHAD domain-containing protein